MLWPKNITNDISLRNEVSLEGFIIQNIQAYTVDFPILESLSIFFTLFIFDYLVSKLEYQGGVISAGISLRNSGNHVLKLKLRVCQIPCLGCVFFSKPSGTPLGSQRQDDSSPWASGVFAQLESRASEVSQEE